MAFPRRAKHILIGLIAVYLVVVAAFLIKIFTTKESKVADQAVQELVTLSETLHEKDPTIRKIEPKEAREIFDNAFLKRGEVIGFNFTLFMQMLNFAILLVAMYGLLWGPMIHFLDERRRSIQTDIETAKEDRQKAEALRVKVDGELKQTRDERRKILDEAEREAEGEREERIEAARKEAEGMIERAKREIEAHVAAGKMELRQDITRLSVELAKKIIEREIKEQDHATLVSQFILEIENKSKESDN